MLILAACAHVPFFLPTPLLTLDALAALLLAGFLPGLLVVVWLVGRCPAPPTRWEMALYSMGAGYGCMVTAMLALSYLPGGVTRTQVLLTFDALLVVLALLVAGQRSVHAAHSPLTTRHSLPRFDRWLLAGLLMLAVAGGFFRFAALVYANFQGDEARLGLRAAEVIQGYENALFVHKKGPTEILLPTVVYSLSQRLNEVAARLPFALANFVGLFAVFLLGRRLFGPVAGWSAAMLIALDGYLIAFGRVVQYQSIVFLMDVLVVLVFVRLWRKPQALTRYLTLAAIFWATGLLSHYEAALVLFPVLYLLWRIRREGTPLLVLARAAVIPLAVGSGLLALFYLPYLRNPAFQDTYYYLTDYRMGGGRVFNHVAEFFARTTVYSSTYYFLTLLGLSVVGLIGVYRRARPAWLGLLLSVALVVGLGITFVNPDWLRFGDVPLLWLFFALALVGGWLVPNFCPAERTIWLWFGAPMILALFFTAIPNTHVYSFFIPWALLVGLVIGRGWAWLNERVSVRTAQALALPLAAAAIVTFGLYEYWLFVYNEVEVLRTWPENRPRGYWVSYEMPVEVAIFGFPHNNGWQAVAGLYADGQLRGNYDTNARDMIAEWYTRGNHYCAGDDLNYFMLATPVEPSLADEYAELRNSVENQFALRYIVNVHNRPALRIYERSEQPHTAPITAQTVNAEDYITRFDRELSSPYFERIGPVSPSALDAAQANTVEYRFGDSIWLRGYRLNQASVAPGDVAEVTLYWSTTAHVTQDYRIFVQVIDLADLAKAGQSDHEAGCTRHQTYNWLPNDVIADRHRIVIDPQARLGQYTLLIGLYTGDEQLEVFDPNGQSLGPHLALTNIAVEPAPDE